MPKHQKTVVRGSIHLLCNLMVSSHKKEENKWNSAEIYVKMVNQVLAQRCAVRSKKAKELS